MDIIYTHIYLILSNKYVNQGNLGAYIIHILILILILIFWKNIKLLVGGRGILFFYFSSFSSFFSFVIGILIDCIESPMRPPSFLSVSFFLPFFSCLFLFDSKFLFYSLFLPFSTLFFDSFCPKFWNSHKINYIYSIYIYTSMLLYFFYFVPWLYYISLILFTCHHSIPPIQCPNYSNVETYRCIFF